MKGCAGAPSVAIHTLRSRRGLSRCHVSRRDLCSGGAALVTSISPFLLHPARGDAITIEEATPTIVPPSGPLPPREKAIVDAFESNTYSVVNVVDVTLQGRVASGAGSVETPEGNGSGVVFDDFGNIVTNYHVLANVIKGLGPAAVGKKVKVASVTVLDTSNRNRSFDAYLVGYDRSKDIAVISIQAPPGLLRPIVLGDSDALRVGQQVLSIGNPFGFDHSLSTGVVSALNRDIVSAGTSIAGGIQTDASINPGNSGGALLDSSGRLVGVNTAIFTPTGVFTGIGFALPSRTVAKIVPELIQYGRVMRPSLGVQVAPAGVAKQLGFTDGAMVQAVAPDSPAAKAGILPTRRGLSGIVAGDVIFELRTSQGKAIPITGESSLTDALDQVSVSEEVTLLLTRSSGSDRTNMEVRVQLQPPKA